MPLHSVFNATSPAAHQITTLFVWILIVSAGILTIVAGAVMGALVRVRARADSSDPSQQYGVRWIELVWTLVR